MERTYPEDLPVMEVDHDLTEEERICPECGTIRKPIGTSSTDQIVIIPAYAMIRRHITHAYACPHCSTAGEQSNVVESKAPRQPIPRGFAAPETLAWVIDQKYNLGLPLYRIEQALAVQGVHVSRQTLSGWMMAGAELLQPIMDALHAELLAGDIIMADDTPLQVLKEPDKAAKSKSCQWVYRTDPFAPRQIILYDHQPHHTMGGVLEFPDGFSGWFQGDGFSGYSQLPDDIRQVGCMAHVRRKFREAAMDLPEEAAAMHWRSRVLGGVRHSMPLRKNS